MAIERGLPAVPRGLSRELTTYLQALQNVILSLSGLGRGTSQTRAVRVSENTRVVVKGDSQVSADKILPGAILSAHLATGAVTTEKLAAGSVIAGKLAAYSVGSANIVPGAVESLSIKDGCITTGKIADHAVTLEKLSECLLPVCVSGTAAHNETVELGEWLHKPLVIIAGYNVPIGSCGELQVEIADLRDEDGQWLFEAKAIFEMGIEDGKTSYPGQLAWLAMGLREADA